MLPGVLLPLLLCGIPSQPAPARVHHRGVCRWTFPLSPPPCRFVLVSESDIPLCPVPFTPNTSRAQPPSLPPPPPCRFVLVSESDIPLYDPFTLHQQVGARQGGGPC